MRLSVKDYPVDIILCLILTIILIPVAVLNINQTLRMILGLPFILFIPGYLLIFALFPNKKTDKGIDILERIALSFGLSIAVVPLIALGLNYTMWGITLNSIINSLSIFILSVGTIAVYRWIKTDEKERFTIDFKISIPSSKNRLDKALNIILIASIIIACGSLVYVITTPKTGEKFTEFYILGPGGIADNYPRNITTNDTANVIIGIANHEYQPLNYTVEIWFINQTTSENETTYHNAWFLYKKNVTLNHSAIDINREWTYQWEYNYSFNINKTGFYKMSFMLFRENTQDYDTSQDYADIIKEKLGRAYLMCHLYIEINESE
jgi:uncharacterized membrane protein